MQAEQLTSQDGKAGFSRILANTAWLMGGKGVGAVLSLAYLAIVTRTLGVADFGRFTLILSAATAIRIVISFDSWQAVVRYGQAHLANADQPSGADALGRLVRFCLGVDILSALSGCILAAIVVLVFGPLMALSADMAWQALAFCMVMLFAIQSTPMGLLRLFDRFDAGALADTMIPVGRMIGATGALFAMPNVAGFLMAWGGAELLCAATYWWLALRATRTRLGSRPAASWGFRHMREAHRENPGILRFLTATNLQNMLASVGSQISVLILGGFVGPAGAGFYRLAYQLGQSLTKVADLLSRSIFVELARASGARGVGGKDELRALFRRTSLLGLTGGCVIVIVILLIGKPLLGLIAGEAFLPAYPLLLLLGISAGINVIGVSYRPLLMATGKAGLSLRITLFSTVLLLVLLFILLPGHGTLGAALASVAASVCGFLLMGWACRRALRG